MLCECLLAAITFTLHHTQLGDRLSALHICLGNSSLDSHILVALPIQIRLELIIKMVGAISAIDLHLHHIDILISDLELLRQCVVIALNPVQLVQD